MARYDEEGEQAPVPMPAIMHSLFSRRTVPSFIVDVSEFAEEKMAAIKAHVSQFYCPESQEPETRNQRQGISQGDRISHAIFWFADRRGGGEPFYVREALNVDDPVALLTRPMNIYS